MIRQIITDPAVATDHTEGIISAPAPYNNIYYISRTRPETRGET